MALSCCNVDAQQQPKPAGGSKPEISQATIIAGRQVFATTCASCHGLDGRGGERAPNILIRPEVQRMSDADIARVIRDGTPSKKMPAFGSSFDAATLRELTAYVRSLLQTNRQSTKLPGDPAAGRTLFFGKAGCSECHMVNGKGGFLGADLSAYAHSHSADDIRQAITDPNKNSARQQKTVSITTRDGQHFTGIARNEDNFSIQLQTPDGAFHLLMRSDLAELKYEPRSLMPADYSQRLTARELDDIISFLMNAAATNSKATAHSQKDSAGRRQ
jgi:cytochrome c oxidase cbb3-type subunit III